jgi:hypothetical protein
MLPSKTSQARKSSVCRSLLLALSVVLAISASEVALAAWQSADPSRVPSAYAQAGDPCVGLSLETASPELAAVCQARQRLPEGLRELAGPIGAKIADQITVAIGAQLQAKKQEALPRLLTRLDEVDLQLQAGLAQTGQLLALAETTLNRAGGVLNDADDTLDDSEDTLDDANDTLDDANDTLDDANDLLDDANDLLDESEELLDETNAFLEQSEAILEQAQAGLAEAEDREAVLRARIDAILAILPNTTAASASSRANVTVTPTPTSSQRSAAGAQQGTEQDGPRTAAQPTATPRASATSAPRPTATPAPRTDKSDRQPKATATPQKQPTKNVASSKSQKE